jgi:hypothetical protein
MSAPAARVKTDGVTKLRVRRFSSGDIPAIERLNERLAAAGLPHRVGREAPRHGDEPSLDNEPIIERLYVATEDEEIRGGVWLKEQLFWSQGAPVRIGWAKYLVSESLIDAKAAGVPAGLLLSLLRQQPHLMGLGMGGHSGPYARILAAARWASSLVPLFFCVINPSRVLRHLSYARTTQVRRMLADALAYSGLAWAGNKLLAGACAPFRRKPARGYTCSVVDRFDSWADEVWTRCRDSYGFIAVRDSRALNGLYPEGFRSLTRLRIQQGGRDVGWICARSIPAAGTWFERHFGNLTLGILTDNLAQPADATSVMEAGFQYLVDEGADVIVTYQSHPGWRRAAFNVGFMRGPSNCAFYRSPAIESLVTKAAAHDRHHYLTCSDGDGPEVV